MRPINIYALTRVADPMDLERLERQMSGRRQYLKIKEWEIAGLRDFCGRLATVLPGAEALRFYYSFVMPKLGKEFDLLRVNDDCVVNVELKSGDVSDEVIRRQLVQNRYYLATLGKNMYSYTYVNGTDRLVRLSNSGRLVEAAWEELAQVLARQQNCYDGAIEELFKEDRYLISPLTDPGRFLRQEYFLTSQQRDIKKHILGSIAGTARGDACSVQGFTGLPGTGKTLLLYDIAMQLSRWDKVCVFHFGSHEKELEQLDERLKRIDFFYCETQGAREGTGVPQVQTVYSAILVDEGHRLDGEALKHILTYAQEWRAPLIFSYDCEDAISPMERQLAGAELIEALSGYVRYHLTNRIRMNSELSAFIGCMMYRKSGNHRQEYPSVSLVYANDAAEEARLLQLFEGDGFVHIQDAAMAACKEYDRVVMCVDERFYYDERGFLRHTEAEAAPYAESGVRNLFHGLSRAKLQVAVIVRNNPDLLDALLAIVQKRREKTG
ncbi:MAG: ATP-binding protein [Lachnospiraceae bacterium]|nr:ATP-binding protein [Lachnospiraceae bacterium]